jgi:hypothetical protein
VSPLSTVIIAAADALPALKERLAGAAASEVLAFADTEALRALQVITTRRPSIVALERVFAGTPRGTALINRIKADPALSGCEIRVVTRDAEYVRVSPRPAQEGGGGTATAVAPAPAAVQPLDQRGTRRAPRFRMGHTVDVLVDGNQAMLVDLSTVGAQVVSGTVLKPNQRVRMVLTDDSGLIRFNAAVAWASFEIPANDGPRYRAGINFLDADGDAVDQFCSRHKAQ